MGQSLSLGLMNEQTVQKYTFVSCASVLNLPYSKSCTVRLRLKFRLER